MCATELFISFLDILASILNCKTVYNAFIKTTEYEVKPRFFCSKSSETYHRWKFWNRNNTIHDIIYISVLFMCCIIVI